MHIDNRLLLLASFLIFFASVVISSAGHLVSAILFLVCAISLGFFSYFQSNKKQFMLFWNGLFFPNTVVIRKPKQSFSGMLFGFLIKHKIFQSMDKTIRGIVLSGSISTGTLSTPLASSRSAILAFFASTVLSVSLSLIGVFVFSNVFFLASLVLPLLVFLYPRISNMLMRSDMVSLYDSEISYFLAYLSIASLAGFGLYASMNRISGKNILASIERDSSMLKKWITHDKYSESMAINNLALNHSHKTFQSFLFSYYDISRSNPDGVHDFVATTSDSEFEKVIDADEKNIGKVSAVFMYGAMAMIMAPIMMVTMLFMITDPNTLSLIVYGIFLIPVVFTLYVFVSNNRHADAAYVPKKPYFLFSFVGIAWYFIFNDVFASLSIAIFLPCIFNGLFVQKQIGMWRSKADGFPVFVRDLIERYKVDSNFVISIKRILSGKNMEQKYGAFSKIVDDVRMRLDIITDKKADLFYDGTLGSKRLKLMMFILQTVFDGGHNASISGMEKIHAFSTKLNHIKNKMDDTLKMSSMLLYVAPFVFFVSMVGLSTMMMSFASSLPQTAAVPELEKFYNIASPDFAGILDSLKPALFIMSLSSGVVISRIAYASLFATLPIGICLAVAFGLFVTWDLSFDAISGIVQSFV